MAQERAVSNSAYLAVLVIGILALSVFAYVALSNDRTTTTSENSSNQQLLNEISLLQSQNQQLMNELATTNATASYNGTIGLNPVAIYRQSVTSIVTVQGTQLDAAGNESVLGSGFVVTVGSADYIVTNYHVVQNDTGITVTFSDGDAYPASVVGTDPYSDLAVLTSNAPASELKPLTISPSSTLSVGDPVIAIGNPFGLAGSETFGIISQLGRTISESLAGDFPIADVIQFSAPINPGNSGGPLIDAEGDVIGITTAVVESSQGVGFAIPSDTILRELPSLVATGHYDMHPYIGIETTDMNYQLSLLEKTNYTYGVLIEDVISGGPASQAGIKGGTSSVTEDGITYSVGGDVIVSVNGTKIVNGDALSSYLEENALPGQKIALGIVRDGTLMTVILTLGTRPPPPSD